MGEIFMDFRLLRHPIPFENESLSNYLIRLSQSNSCPVEWIYNKLFITKDTAYYYLNTLIKLHQLKTIAKITNMEIEEIISLTIYRFNRFNITKENLGAKSYLYKNTSQCCPLCMNENPYHRIYWHLKYIRVCLEHNILLISHCTYCGIELKAKNVIEGKCSCGEYIKNMKVVPCENRKILRLQKKLYQVFGIQSEYYKPSKYFINISPSKFIEFFHFLYLLIMPYYDELNSIREVVKKVDHSKELTVFLYIERILSDWPKSFYLLLDDFNNYLIGLLDNPQLIKECDKNYEHIMIYLYNPVNLVYLSNAVIDSREFTAFSLLDQEWSFLYDSLWEYFKKNYTSEFFLHRIEDEYIKKPYIDVNIADIICCTSRCKIIENCQIHYINGNEYVDINDIVDFVHSFLDNNSVFKGEQGYASVIEIYHMFSRFKIHMTDILKRTISKSNW
jgi:hypothetical protein